MKKNLFVFLCLWLFNVTVLHAQNGKIKTGLDLGYTYSVRHANLSNFVDSKYDARYGIGVNFSAEYLLWRTLFIASGISLLEKNYEYKRTGDRAAWYTKFNNIYIQVPLSIGGYLINNPYKDKGVWIKVSGGVYAEHWLSMFREGQYPIAFQFGLDEIGLSKVSERYDFKKNDNRLERLGYGLQGGAQLGYSLNRIDIFTAYNYQYGLSDINKINKDKNKKSTTRSYMISLGISYKF